MKTGMHAIRAWAREVARTSRPERIVLFGSHARKGAGPDSDVDVLVVVPFRGKPWEAAARIRRQAPPRFPLDLVVRTPEEVSRRIAIGDPFFRDVLDQGVTLYEA